MSSKRLYRSRTDRMISGVCGGIGAYLKIDPTLIRLAFLFLAIWGGGGVLAYFIAWLVIPEEPLDVPYRESQAPEDVVIEGGPSQAAAPEPPAQAAAEKPIDSV